MKARRRRGIILLLLALASGGLAATQVRERERRVESQVGPMVGVVVAARDVAAGDRLAGGDLAVKRVPARFVPPDAVGSPAQLSGARAAVGVRAGSYLTAALVAGGAHADGAGALRPGERALEIAVTGGAALAGAGPGSRVDVLVSTQRQDGAGRTFIALEGVEVLDLRSSGAPALGAEESPDVPAATAVATLRVTLRQAVYLSAADNFSHEVRLLARPPGDERSVGSWSVSEEEL